MADPIVARPVLSRATPPSYEPVQLYTGVFSAAQCDRIVATGGSMAADDAGLEGDGGLVTTDSSVRRSRVVWIPPEPHHDWIYRKLATVVRRANRRYQFDLTGFEEDLQFTTYEGPGAFYTWHQDGLDATVGHRKLSLVVQLSDPADYEGGELEFFGWSSDEVPVEVAQGAGDSACGRGTVIVFPSFEYHRVRPLRAGVRHSLVSWVSGPPFR
jgi:PKHD-type hydroxylase